MKLFDLDSPLMQFLNKVADMMWLNILTLICCIPIITVGPALTALHYMALKMARNEECYITRDYFKSFKLNLRQGILIWLIQLVVIVLLIGDFLILNYSAINFGQPMKIILMVVSIVVLFTFTFVYPVLAKFDNAVSEDDSDDDSVRGAGCALCHGAPDHTCGVSVWLLGPGLGLGKAV